MNRRNLLVALTVVIVRDRALRIHFLRPPRRANMMRPWLRSQPDRCGRARCSAGGSARPLQVMPGATREGISERGWGPARLKI